MDKDNNWKDVNPRDGQEPRPTGMMAKMSPTDLPEDAVALSNDQVLRMQYHLIQTWKPRSEIWPFKMGPSILAGGMALTGVVSLYRIRQALFLRGIGRWTTFLATVPIPAITGTIINLSYVGQPILLKDIGCPICIEMRACGIQFGFGIIQPIILALISCCTMANTSKTFYLPPFSQPLQLLQEYYKLIKPMNGTIMALVALNLFTAFAITRRQLETAPLIHNRLRLDGSPHRP